MSEAVTIAIGVYLGITAFFAVLLAIVAVFAFVERRRVMKQ